MSALCLTIIGLFASINGLDGFQVTGSKRNLFLLGVSEDRWLYQSPLSANGNRYNSHLGDNRLGKKGIACIGHGSADMKWLVTTKSEEAVRQKDPPKQFTNSIGMVFVWIPSGTFLMGSPKEEHGREPRASDETQHKVTLSKGFYMGVYAVTQEQWQTVMGNNPSTFKGKKNLPVEMVSWNDCQEFIMKLRRIDKKAYRLPSEAEWEYCCRAGTTTSYYFGKIISTDLANFNGQKEIANGRKGVHRGKTMPVGSFPANAWGLYDMHGNVYQWCQDWEGDYPQKDVVDPKGPDKGEGRVLRGGSWISFPTSCRSACRAHWEAPDVCQYCYGFRLCLFLD